MKRLGKKLACAGALAALGTAAETAYFYGRTMKRNEVDMERTIKMAGTDWSQYTQILTERKTYMMAQTHEDVHITSFDGLKLHATYFPAVKETDRKRVVICFHGYTSKGLADFTGLTDYYFRRGYAMLHPDARAHGESEGTYIGFGCLDRRDALRWIRWVTERCNGRGDCAYGGRNAAAFTGKRSRIRLRLYFAEGSVHTCAEYDVPSSGISGDSGGGFREPQAGGLRHG